MQEEPEISGKGRVTLLNKEVIGQVNFDRTPFTDTLTDLCSREKQIPNTQKIVHVLGFA